MRIAMPRGDIRLVRFLIKEFGGIATDVDFTSVYFTVKKNTRDQAFLFQKTLNNGILKLDSGDYQVKIESEDTANLAYGNYKFDIQLSWKDEENVEQLKETFVGDFVVNDEVTFNINEG